MRLSLVAGALLRTFESILIRVLSYNLFVFLLRSLSGLIWMILDSLINFGSVSSFSSFWKTLRSIFLKILFKKSFILIGG